MENQSFSLKEFKNNHSHKIHFWNDFIVIRKLYGNGAIYRRCEGKILDLKTREPQFSKNYMLICWDNDITIYDNELKIIRKESICGHNYKIFEWNGPGILCSGDLYFADGTHAKLESELFHVTPLSNGVFYYSKEFKFYDFDTRTERTLACVSRKEWAMHAVPEQEL